MPPGKPTHRLIIHESRLELGPGKYHIGSVHTSTGSTVEVKNDIGNTLLSIQHPNARRMSANQFELNIKEAGPATIKDLGSTNRSAIADDMALKQLDRHEEAPLNDRGTSVFSLGIDAVRGKAQKEGKQPLDEADVEEVLRSTSVRLYLKKITHVQE